MVTHSVAHGLGRLWRAVVAGLVLAAMLVAGGVTAQADETPSTFSFLPPLAKAAPLDGGFDGGLSPVVQVCPTPGCEAPLVTFTTGGAGSEAVRVDADDEHYIVNWHTARTGAVPGATYHIRVTSDGVALGSIAVTVAGPGRRPASSGPVVSGTVPIKFRVTDPGGGGDPDPAVADRIVVDPETADALVGGTQQFTATVYDQHGELLADQSVDWSSSDETVATVDGDGLATAIAAGTTTITATAGAVNGSAALAVTEPTPEDIIWGADVLYFTDFVVGADRVRGGLETLRDEGIITLTVATSRDDALARMDTGGHEVLVYFNQNTGLRSQDVTGLVGWINAGHKTIYSDWTWNTTVLAALETRQGASANQQPLTLLDDRLAVGVQNPMPLANTGWGVWSTGLAPAPGTDAVSVCAFPNGDSCLVYGNAGRTATVGFLNDTVTETDGRNFTRNLLRIVVEGTAVTP
jgi:hypothetical protein